MRQAVDVPPREPLRPVELPFRSLRAGDEEWNAREGGLTASGRGSPAPLLLLFFARADDPEHAVRELLVAGRRLDDLSDDELIEALGRARPFREERERLEVFPDTRKRGSKGI